jgi:hypothetical protein
MDNIGVSIKVGDGEGSRCRRRQVQRVIEKPLAFFFKSLQPLHWGSF